PDRDAIFDEHLGCPSREADGVGISTRLDPGGIVDVELAELDTKGAVDFESMAGPQGVFYVPRPRLGRPNEFEVAVVAADQLHVLDPRVHDVRLPVAGKLRSMAGPVGDVDGRCEGNCGSGDRADLLDLGGRSVLPAEPRPSGVWRRRKCLGCKVIDVRKGR